MLLAGRLCHDRRESFRALSKREKRDIISRPYTERISSFCALPTRAGARRKTRVERMLLAGRLYRKGGGALIVDRGEPPRETHHTAGYEWTAV